MQKICLTLLLLMLYPIAQSIAAEKEEIAAKPPLIQLEYDRKTQIRDVTPLKIKKAIDAQSLLSEKGDIYSLTGLDFPPSDASLNAYKRLAELTEGKKCTLYQTRSDKVGRVNRMNQILGHLTCGNDDIWIQGTFIAGGLARVRTTPENKDLAKKMLALEDEARTEKRGLWSLPENQLLTPQTASQNLNSFAIIEGKVYSTAQNKESIFLNFTSDWKTDFSIGIPSKLRKDFSKLRIDPISLKGKKIRVRGWLRNYNGPYIELDHIEQLEVISDKEPVPQEDSKTEKNIEAVTEDSQSESNPVSKPTPQKYMHTIKGPSAPIVEEPKVPKLEKETDGKAN